MALPSSEVRAPLKAKGWTNALLAQRWKITPVWVSQIINNPDRAPHYDDAIKGLPRCAVKPVKRGRKPAAASREPRQARKVKRPAGYRYSGILAMGAVLAAERAFGSMAEEGEYGVVVEVIDDGTSEAYRVAFACGCSEVLGPDLFEQYFIDVGLDDAGAAQYKYQGEDRLEADVRGGRFVHLRP